MMMTDQEQMIAPGSSELQKSTSEKIGRTNVPRKCAVTGGTGFVGLRLVEMLIERGAEEVIAVDIVSIEDLPERVKKYIWDTDRIKYVKGDITKLDDLVEAFEGVDCVWHVAAAVGPFHPMKLYYKVNAEGTMNVVEACKRTGVKKIVMSSSPSTRMNGEDIQGLREEDMRTFEEMQGKFTQAYAETKFIGEKHCLEACSDDLLTIAVAPHQVYGPRDGLFLPNMLEVAAAGKLRIFSRKSTGYGKNKISMTHVDNYCHGLIIAEEALTVTSNCRGKFYMITDGKGHPEDDEYAYFWDVLDVMIVRLGFPSLKEKAKLPYWFLMPLATVLHNVMKIFGSKSRLSPFTVTMLTMHRWFSTHNAEADLGYEPIISFEDGWNDTYDWFSAHWLPEFKERSKGGSNLLSNVSSDAKKKIDIQAKNVLN